MPAEDFSNREFVFSPAPVLPDLPSLPSAPSLVSFPDDGPQDDGRPVPKRNRGRRGKGVEAQPVQPEIHLQPSPDAPYAFVAGVLVMAKKAGLQKVGVVN